MAAITDSVRPGDVISSDLMNRIIALLNDHDAALAGAGGSTSTGTVITGFNPPAKQNVGLPLTVLGTFDFPLDSNTVSIDGLPIAPAQFLIGSGSSQVVFNIPTSIVVPASGSKPVVVRVFNSQGSGERNYLLLPQVAGPPKPTVSAAVDLGTNATPLRSGSNAKITGQNFGGPAATNKVRLIFNPGAGNETTFPPAAGDSLVIDEGQSSIQPAPADSSLVVMMPAIGASLIPVVGQTAPAALEITAPGGQAQFSGITIRRMA